MIVLGVDPGTIVLGYGLIESHGDDMALVHYDTIKCKARSGMSERLLFLHTGLTKAVKKYRPDVMAIESPFVGENARSAIAIGKAQAIVLLIAAQNRIPIYEYSPAQVKHHVADYGASSKEQIQQMVKMLLELEELPEPHDAADALAVAICHLRECRMQGMLGSLGRRTV